jgi:glycosyltransferase involved in cell wall biosynthesis
VNGARVLVLTTGYHPTIGGAETYARTIGHALAARGHDVLIATDRVGGEPGRSVDGPVRVARLHEYRSLLDDPSKLAWEQLYFGVLPELGRVLGDWRPDVVLANSLETTIVGRMVADDLDIRLVGAYHEQDPLGEPFGIGRMSLAYRRSAPDLVLAGSRMYADRARAFLPADRVRLVHHGIDTDLFHPDTDGSAMRKRFGIEDEHVLIVNSGRLKERKGQLELVRAFATVADGSARLLIAGSVSSASIDYADGLYAEIDRLGLTARVTIAQDITYPEMPGLLAAADMVAQPSLAEGFGLAVLEAMSTARPVIATRIDGFEDLRLTPDNAVVVATREVDRLGHALAGLVADAGRRAALGQAGRCHVVENFSLAAMADRTELAVRSVIAGGS